MKILFTQTLILIVFFLSACDEKQELATPNSIPLADKYIGHWTKATVIYNVNIEYKISKKDTTFTVNEIISCKGADCSQVKPSNLNYTGYFDKTKLHLKVLKEGKYLPFIYDDISGWLYVDAFSYIKVK